MIPFNNSLKIASQTLIELLDGPGNFQGKRVEHSFESIALEIVVDKIGQRLPKFFDLPAQSVLITRKSERIRELKRETKETNRKRKKGIIYHYVTDKNGKG